MGIREAICFFLQLVLDIVCSVHPMADFVKIVMIVVTLTASCSVATMIDIAVVLLLLMLNVFADHLKKAQQFAARPRYNDDEEDQNYIRQSIRRLNTVLGKFETPQQRKNRNKGGLLRDRDILEVIDIDDETHHNHTGHSKMPFTHTNAPGESFARFVAYISQNLNFSDQSSSQILKIVHEDFKDNYRVNFDTYGRDLAFGGFKKTEGPFGACMIKMREIVN